jgi:hypothetical protein
MAHFYLTLPSNSSTRYFPDNTVAHFITKLANPVELSGDWEVALFEIQYQHSWNNLDKRDGAFTYSQKMNIDGEEHNAQSTVSLASGYYNTGGDLVQAVNSLIESIAKKNNLPIYTNFKYSSVTNRTSAIVTKDTRIYFSPVLSDMLGADVDQNPIINNDTSYIEWLSKSGCNISRRFTSIFVYCNILEHVPVGESKVPLLRIVKATSKRDEVIHIVYDKPLYVPVQQRNFDNIEIDLRTDTGRRVPFEYGRVIVTLHFRLRKIPYLLQ